MKNLMTESEISTVRSMNMYWEEVSNRDDQSPLNNELSSIVRMFGTKLLDIVADYADEQYNSKAKETK